MYNKAALNMFASLQLLKLVLFISVASNILPQHIRFKLQIYFLHTASINIFFSSSQEYICLQTTSSNILFQSAHPLLIYLPSHSITNLYFSQYLHIASKYLQHIKILKQVNIESYNLDTCKVRTVKKTASSQIIMQCIWLESYHKDRYELCTIEIFCPQKISILSLSLIV